MNTLLSQIYHSAASNYIKFRKRLDKNISSGKFKQFTRRKQQQLLHKVERLRRRVLQLQTQLKLAAAGAGISLILNTAPAIAQTTVGPFVRNHLENPLRPPLPAMDGPMPTYVDLDGDGDKDLVSIEEYSQTIKFFENIGTPNDPFFVGMDPNDPEYPFSGVASSMPSGRYNWVPAFADIDDDGDYDLIIGADQYTPIYAGELFFFRNSSATQANFILENDATNPFLGIQSVRFAHPSFADLDEDGDLDLLLGGYDGISTYNYIAQYFKNTSIENTGNAQTPGFVPESTSSLAQSVNDIYFTRRIPNAFADLDEDGDMDFFFNVYGQIHYRRNDEGVFSNETVLPDQTGPWMQDPGDPTKWLGNPLEGISLINANGFTFADLDLDGDMDLTANYSIDNPPHPDEVRPFLYYENKGHGVFEYKEGLDSPLDGIDMVINSSVGFADVDTDGDLDIIASGNSDHYVNACECYQFYTFSEVFINTAGAYDEPAAPVDLPHNMDEVGGNAKLKYVDADADGDLDLVVPWGSYSGKVQYFQNDLGIYTQPAVNPFGFINEAEEVDLDIGDLDNDGKPDLILGPEAGPLRAYRNTSTSGAPVFESMPAWQDAFGPDVGYFNPKFFDLDHDGDLDIVLGKSYVFWYYENIGTPSEPEFLLYKNIDYTDAGGITRLRTNNPFADIETFDTDGTATPNFADIDGDGDDDLLFGSFYGGSDGNGQFTYYENQNPAPVTTLVSSLAIVQGSTASVLDATITISDSDNDLFVEARISIANFKPGEEILGFTPVAGITGLFDAVTGILTLTGKAPAGAYQTLLRSVTYQFIGPKPASSGRMTSPAGKTVTLSRSIGVKVFDVDFTSPVPKAIALQISFPNAIPTLTASASAPNFTGSAVLVDPGIAIADGDDATLASATVAIDPAKLIAAQDLMVFNNQNGITGTYNSSTGILSLTGISSVANYQTALRSVQYNNQSTTPLGNPRTVTFVINDGESSSNITSINVNVNTPPVITPVPVVTQIGSSVTLDLTTIISDPNNNLDPASLKIITQPTSGATATISNGILTIDYSATNYAGPDVVRIEACDLNGACSQADISITVEGDIIVNNGFSPNGDGFNPKWIITNITTLEPQNKVSLFTRWGDKIFEIDNYNNDDRVFDGTTDSGKEVVSGTYFYKIEFSSGRPTKTGYLVIKR